MEVSFSCILALCVRTREWMLCRVHTGGWYFTCEGRRGRKKHTSYAAYGTAMKSDTSNNEFCLTYYTGIVNKRDRAKRWRSLIDRVTITVIQRWEGQAYLLSNIINVRSTRAHSHAPRHVTWIICGTGRASSRFATPFPSFYIRSKKEQPSARGVHEQPGTWIWRDKREITRALIARW